MKNSILVQRYAHGLIDALSGAEEYRAVLGELKDMAGLLFTPGALEEFLVNPFVVKSKKGRVLRDVLSRAALDPKTTRFLLLLLDHDRLPILPDIIEALPALWNESHGVITAWVASVVPLNEDQRRRLAETLARLEGRPVALDYVVDPELVGGLTVTIGYQVYDVSIKGRTEKIRDIITEG